MLFYVDGRRLASRADHAYAIRAFGDVPFHEFAQGGVIDLAVLVQGRRHCNNAASDGFHVKELVSEASIKVRRVCADTLHAAVAFYQGRGRFGGHSRRCVRGSN